MFQQPTLIGANSSVGVAFLPPLAQARAAGPIDEYTFREIKPKKKLKEMSRVLTAEKKSFFFIKYGWKFNLKDRCIVCGMHHIWENGDYMRPPIPLSHVTKGRPMRGTYCPKHATHHKQLEMLQQQILADEHGLDFKAFIPKPRMPQVLSKGALTTLSKADVVSLIGVGWQIKPPNVKGEETTLEEVVRLSIEIRLASERMNTLIEKGE
jgi:hypothetical protein